MPSNKNKKNTQSNQKSKQKNKQLKNSFLLCFFHSLSEDQSLLALVASNFLVLLFAVFDNWSIAPILFIFWFESVIIGILTFTRLLFFDHGEGFKVSDFAKNIMAFFFAFHYGFFHFVYLCFILAFAFSFSAFSNEGVLFFFNPFFLLSLIIIIGNKVFSEIYNAGDYVKSFNQTMIEPYARIIPMHLTLLFGSFAMIIFGSSIFMLILFLILKTLFDISGHKLKHSRK